MATLVLSTVGTLVGGPIGGLIGATLGRELDRSIIGAPTREGPRLRELALTTASYGTPIPRVLGTMRLGGTIVWATPLTETREKGGGGKGRPATTAYSYSASFAVALASAPIAGVGRIWADGNLLRGAAGDLKTGGTLRVHRGHGDQAPDPLIASALGAEAGAFRDLAYLVFEDLALADFGNRLPALSVEVFGPPGPVSLGALADGAIPGADAVALAGLDGVALEGGAVRDILEMVGAFYPFAWDPVAGALFDLAKEDGRAGAPLLPEPVPDPAAGAQEARTGVTRLRAPAADAAPRAIRYYDAARDYQPGLQYAQGRAGSDWAGPNHGGAPVRDLPATLSAATAKGLIEAAVQRAEHARDRLSWRTATLDPALGPGRLVRAPGIAGLWRIAAWEWRDGVVELELLRAGIPAAADPATDQGTPVPPVDRPAGTLRLAAFGLPWDGTGAPGERRVFAALGADDPATPATLYAERDGALDPVASTARAEATLGTLAAVLPPSPALRYESGRAMEIALAGRPAGLVSASQQQLAAGANRLLVGGEVLQFGAARHLGGGRWRLTGLLRGRGGTEPAALLGHAAGAPVVRLDDALIAVPVANTGGPEITGLTAIGQRAGDPVHAAILDGEAGIRPLLPVHPRVMRRADGGLACRWTRRARGGWHWRDGVDVPLVEDSEAWLVGLGPVAAPLMRWTVTAPAFDLAPAAHADWAARHPGAPLWVRQVGALTLGPPLLLTRV